MALEDSSRLMQAYVEKAIFDLPSLPTAVVRIVQATERDDVNTHEIEEIISTEPAVATKLLRVVNSAYFGMPRKIVSINQAIGILGLKQVRNLVLSLGVFNALSSNRQGVDRIHCSLWQRSFGTAACASILSKAKRYSAHDQETLFIAGLLHDIGVLFFLTQFSSVYTQVLHKSQNDSVDLAEIERLVLHADHARIGAMLAERWNFPSELTKLIEDHEDPGDPILNPLSALLHVSVKIVYAHLGDNAAGFQPPLDDKYKAWLDYSEDQTQELLAAIQEQVEKAAQMIGVIA